MFWRGAASIETRGLLKKRIRKKVSEDGAFPSRKKISSHWVFFWGGKIDISGGVSPQED